MPVWQVWRLRFGRWPVYSLLFFFAGWPETRFFLFGDLEGLEGTGCRCCGGFAAFGFGTFEVVSGEDLEGKLAIGFGPAGFWVVEGDRLAVAGGFGEADVARDGGLEELVIEESLQV